MVEKQFENENHGEQLVFNMHARRINRMIMPIQFITRALFNVPDILLKLDPLLVLAPSQTDFQDPPWPTMMDRKTHRVQRTSTSDEAYITTRMATKFAAYAITTCHG